MFIFSNLIFRNSLIKSTNQQNDLTKSEKSKKIPDIPNKWAGNVLKITPKQSKTISTKHCGMQLKIANSIC